MRNLRWAAELSASRDGRLADLGVAELNALLESALLEDEQKIFVEAALSVVYGSPEAELDRLGDDAEVVQYLAEEGMDTNDQDRNDVSSQASSEGSERDG